MSLFQNLRESLGGYWTPEKPKPKRTTRPPFPHQRTTRSPSLAEAKARLDREGTASPGERMRGWVTQPLDDSTTPKALGVKGSKVSKTPSPNKQSAKAQRKFWHRVLPKFLSLQPVPNIQDDIEGSTAIGEDGSRGPSISSSFHDEDTQVHFHEGDAQPSLIAPGDDDRLYQPTAQDLELMKSWTPDQVWLFHELNNRSFKPLIRETWWLKDFVTLPDEVVSDDEDQVLIKNHAGNEYNACRALRKLFFLGSRVRDKVVCGLRSEPAMRRELNEYYKWTIKDAGLSRLNHIPLLTICTASPNESVDCIVGRITDQLQDYGRQYRHLFSAKDPETGELVKDPETGSNKYIMDLPTLYGIIIYQNVATVVTYDSRYPKKGVQLMNTNNFVDGDEDVWHAFSMAITMVKARDDLIRLMEDGVSWAKTEDEIDNEDD
ncbi:MAG: hypothetical protein Q9166_003321 [cf. Caloplaca sp. 2 TL-2023]